MVKYKITYESFETNGYAFAIRNVFKVLRKAHSITASRQIPKISGLALAIDKSNILQPSVKLKDAPLHRGDISISMVRVPYDLTSNDTTADATWTQTSGSGAPRHSVVLIQGVNSSEDHTTMVQVLVMRSFRNNESASLSV